MEDVKIDYTKKGYRLPTESEWEFACRAGTTTDFYWGNTINDRYLWYWSNSQLRPKAVGGKLPNSFGLFDMSGNVREWCNDWYAPYTPTDKIDPKGPNDSPNLVLRVVRNGSYNQMASSSTSFHRSMLYPHEVSTRTGFRIVLEQ
jgi:formylglycine-generating enzyme required for sulfatase activity